MEPNRPILTDPVVLQALAHPVRLDVLNYLMSEGPATATVCARAVGDTPSNCSYHLRVLARHGLVEAGRSPDGRERPWRTAITGFETGGSELDPAAPEAQGAAAVLAASVALDQRLLRDYLSNRDRSPAPWRQADQYSTYTLRITPSELRDIARQLDAIVRPLIAATRRGAPPDARLVHLGFHAFPRSDSPWD